MSASQGTQTKRTRHDNNTSGPWCGAARFTTTSRDGMLRYLSDPGLWETITAITNRTEGFHHFADWLAFGAEQGVIATTIPSTRKNSPSSTRC
jgi:hypothetical protein